MMRKLLIFMTFYLMECIDCCAIQTDRPLTEEVKKNLKSPWLVLITDETITSPIGISYGAIIKENIVLTSAKAVLDHEVDNLLALTDCEIVDWNENLSPKSCLSKRAASIYPNYVSKENIIDSDWVMLILEEPFELTNRINTIPIINDDNFDDIDKNNCFVYQWMLEHNTIDVVPITFQYRLGPDEAGFKIVEDEVEKLITGGDCFLDSCPNLLTTGGYTTFTVSFLGSPIACSLKNDPSQYIQTGLATVVYELYRSVNENTANKYEISEGSLYDLSFQRKEINETLMSVIDAIQ
ncbi:uncharacterized protein LOC130674528 [Microplitis mediator]|uniref:uncharacterized protein LOC130674528 n=1 Tax=Microplitis mediator TaxID=375433 RepID=UPI002557B058|nr:uncharacterized protein LOC130674528 [Microplitis mediator]